MRPPVRFGVFLAVGLGLAGALAFFVSPQASSAPDGLERVAIDSGFDVTEDPHALDGLPTAGYGIRGVDDDGLSTGWAGLLGVSATFVLVGGLLHVARRTSSRAPSTSP